jgi:hypothetical protein
MVEPDRRSLILLLLLALCSPALSQTIAMSDDDGSGGRANAGIIKDQNTFFPLQSASGSQAPSQPPPKPQDSEEKPYGWHIAIYPALAWAPIFGASVTLPPTPSQPISTPGPSGSTDGSLNGAFFGGASFEKGKWSADLLFMWAGLSAERETPFTKVDMNFVFGDAMVGREVIPDLYLQGGVRRLSLDIHADVGTARAVPLASGTLLSVSLTVGSWGRSGGF